MAPIASPEPHSGSYATECFLRERERARLQRHKRARWRLALACLIAGRRGARRRVT